MKDIYLLPGVPENMRHADFFTSYMHLRPQLKSSVKFHLSIFLKCLLKVPKSSSYSNVYWDSLQVVFLFQCLLRLLLYKEDTNLGEAKFSLSPFNSHVLDSLSKFCIVEPPERFWMNLSSSYGELTLVCSAWAGYPLPILTLCKKVQFKL